MSYNKTTWVNDSSPYLSAEKLNKIESGIKDNGQIYDTKALLTADTDPPPFARVLGYTTKNDGGTFNAYWVLGDTTTPDSFVLADDANTGRWFILPEGGAYSCNSAGALPDYSTDISTAMSNAIADAGVVPMKTLSLRCGLYKQASSIPWGVSTILIGAQGKGNASGSGACYIEATASMTAMLSGSTDIADTNLVGLSHIEGIHFNGSNTTDYAIRGVGNHCTFKHLRLDRCNEAAMQFSYGWCNYYQDVDCRTNGGNGMDVRENGESNQNLFDSCKFITSDIGFKGGKGKAQKLNCCLLEQNEETGVFLGSGSRAFSIDTNYFESNAQVSAPGHTFTSPTTYNIKADIICNGTGSDTTISQATPYAGSVVNSFTDSDPDIFIFAQGTLGLTVFGNHANLNTIELVRYYGADSGTTPSYGTPARLNIGQNYNFSLDLNVDSIPGGIISAADQLRTTLIQNASNRNIADTDFNQWTVLTGSGGTWQRSSTEFFENPKTPVWEIEYLSSGTSETRGFSLDMSKFPQYHNKFFVFGIWTKHSFSSDGAAVVQVANVNHTTSYDSITDWTFRGGFFKFATTGTYNFGFRKIGASGTVLAAAPVLCEIGANIDALTGLQNENKIFYGSAMPTAGTWPALARVINDTPTVDGNNMVLSHWLRLTTGSGHVLGTDWAAQYYSTVSPAT